MFLHRLTPYMHSSRLPWLAVAAAALLAGCQVFGSSPSGSSSAQVTPGRILSRTPQAVGTSTGLQLTTQVKRDTLTENVTVNGQATPLLAARLVAPFAGTVARLAARVGEQVSPGVAVVELADLSSWELETEDMTELGVVTLRVGDPATIRFDALPELELGGTVARIEALGENRQGDITYTVTVVPERQDERLRWNMTATVAIDPQ